MNKFKKALFSLLAVTTLSTNVVGLAGCGSNKGTVGNVNVVAYDGTPVTITFYHTMGQKLQEVLDEYIPKFNELYPNITVEHSSQGDYPGLRNNIATELTAGNSPHIAYCYPDHIALYNKTKRVVQLDNFINSTLEIPASAYKSADEDSAEEGEESAETPKQIMGFTKEQIEDFIPGFYEEGKAYGDDKMYTLPFSKSTELLYYNKTEFEKQGWSVPTTWDEMEALCKTIKDMYGDDVIPFGYDSEANWFITMTEQMGTPYTSATGKEKYLFNTKENREWVEKLRDWYKKGYFTTEEIYKAYTSDLFTETDPTKQKSFMCIGSSAGASYQCPDKDSEGNYPFEVGVTQIPQIDPTNPKAIQQGPSICMFKKSDMEVAASWLFVKYFTSTMEFQADFSRKSGYAPVIQSAYDDPIYKDKFLAKADGNAYLQASCVLQTLAQMNSYYVSPAFVGSSAARDQVGALMQACFTKDLEGTSVSEFIKKEFETTIYSLKYESSN